MTFAVNARRRSAIVATVIGSLLALLLVALATQSQAAFPGKNGLIAFEGLSVDGSGDIFVMNANGSDSHSVSLSPESEDSNPAISPNGRKIVFVSTPTDNSTSSQDGAHPGYSSTREIYTMDVDGSDRMPLTNTHRAFEACPSFSPNGRKVVFIRSNPHQGLWLMNADGSHEHRLTRASDGCPSFSPDGRTIVFPRSVFVGDRERSEIFAMNSNGSKQRPLTHNLKPDFEPSFSPDGRKIVFTGRAPQTNVFIMNADGSHLHQLTHHPRKDASPCFSPDGRKIVFESSRTGHHEIYVMNANGSHQRRLTNGQTGGYLPNWGPLAR